MTFDSNNRKEIKIVIAGLDNAGKTSSLIALRHKYNFYERVKNLKPTIKVDYNSFNFLNYYIINLWDMGGQEKYRTIYINNPVYFNETDYLYFLIDIQDELKFQTAVHYLHDILDVYRTMNYQNEVIICFNKYDPKYRANEEFKDRVDMLKTLILSQNRDMKFKFFKMSIYDISSITKAFSYSLNKLLNLSEINEGLKNIVKKYNCDYIILYNKDGLIISDYYQEIMDTKDFDEIIGSKINEDLEFFQRLLDEKVNIDEKIDFTKDKTEYVKKIVINTDNGSNSFYLRVSAPPKRISEIKEEFNDIKGKLTTIFPQK
ncbi:MAG: ADP-ribosylation factor-like protein [Promethearchaeota archaeon]